MEIVLLAASRRNEWVEMAGQKLLEVCQYNMHQRSWGQEVGKKVKRKTD